MRFGFIGFLTIVVLSCAGCSAGSPQPLPISGAFNSQVPSPSSRGISGLRLLYVAMAVGGGGAVSIFRQNGSDQRSIGEISQGIDTPFGLFVDKRRNLYVTNAYNGTVTVYPRGSDSPSETLSGAGAPIDVVVGRDGTVYVANAPAVFNFSGNGSVLEYRSGHTRPSKTIVTFEKKSYPGAVALDSSDNLFVAYNHKYGASYRRQGSILEFSAGSPSGKNLGIRVGQAGGLTIDKNDDLVLVQDGNSFYFPPAIDIFTPGRKKPSKQIPLPCSGGYDVALNKSNSELWVTCPVGAVVGMTYPDGAIVDTIVLRGSSFITGVATSPDGSQ